MKARAFNYVRPATVVEALAAFEGGEDASYIAGGQSLVPALALRLQAPDVLIDIAHIPDLRGIELKGNWLRIGALTRHAEVLVDPLIRQHAPLYSDAAPHVAHPAIRNKGTLGGSIAHADPASEFPAMTLALGAELEIANRDGSRRVPADEFFLDLFQTAIEPGELLVAIHVPVVGPGQLGLLRVEDLYNPPTRPVTDRLARAVAVLALPADLLAVVGLEPAVERAGGHVHQLLEGLVGRLVVVILRVSGGRHGRCDAPGPTSAARCSGPGTESG